MNETYDKTLKKLKDKNERIDSERELNEQLERAKVFFKEKNFIITDEKLKVILSCLKLRYPILAVGGTGTGKTHFFGLLSEFLKGSYEYASLNGSVTIHDLTQERILDSKGNFTEKDMILARWLRKAQKEMSILQLDEVNAAKPETLLALHPIMDIKGELRLPYSNEILKVNDNAVLIMSCNEGDEYAGINAMNMAFQNRYIKIHFTYLVGDELATLLSTRTGVTFEEARMVGDVWEKYMASKEPEQAVIGLRLLERWCELSHYLGLRTAGKFTFGSLIARDEDELIEIVEGDFFINLPGTDKNKKSDGDERNGRKGQKKRKRKSKGK